jgi:hypothetical protein
MAKRLGRRLSLPIETDGARILAVRGREVFTAYVPRPRSPVFMTLLEKTFGKEVTTRTWETVRKCAARLPESSPEVGHHLAREEL